MKLIVGLGNPGEEYKDEAQDRIYIYRRVFGRENIGNMREKFKSVYAEMTYKGEKYFSVADDVHECQWRSNRRA